MAVARKELFEGFRDRQTLIYTFVLPVCMYPAIFWVIVQGALLVMGQSGAKDVRVAIAAPQGLVEDVTQQVAREGGGSGGAVETFMLESAPADDEAARALLREEGEDVPDAILVLSGPTAGEDSARVYFDSTESRSEIAQRRVTSSLESWASEIRDDVAEERSVDPKALDPFVIESRNVSEEKDQGALVLSLILPLLLVVMCVLGAFFPAVDLTAGEKERGTAETTMLLPVPRTSVHLGKILAVCTGAVIATTLNLVALALSAGHLLQQLGAVASKAIPVELPFGALFAITPLAVLYSFFVAASLTGIASLAASFKEGQALLGPVQMLFILPAMAAQVPGLTLDVGTAFIPVVNVALAFRGMLVGDVQTIPLILCAIALAAYAAAAIWFSVRLRSNEQVALAGETLSMRRLAGLLRSSKR